MSTSAGKDAATVLEGGPISDGSGAEEKKDGEDDGTATDASTPKDAGRLSAKTRKILENKLLSKKHGTARLSCAASTFQSHYDVDRFRNRHRFNSGQFSDIAEDESDGEPKRHSNRRRGAIGSTEKSWRNFLEKTDLSSVLDQDGHGDHGHGEDHDHGYIAWYSRPVQRQHWKDDQSLPHVNWGDLFFDLIYVGAAYNLGIMLISAANRNDWPRGVLYFVAIFGPLYNAWETSVFYASKYTTCDYTHRIVEAVRYFFVSSAVLHIKEMYILADPARMETLLLILSLFIESFIQLLLHLELLWVGVGDRTAIVNDTKRTLRRTLIPMALLFLAATILAGIGYSNDEIDYYSGHSGATGNDTSYKFDKHSGAFGSNSYPSPSLAGYAMTIESDLPLGLCCIGYVLNIAYQAIREKQLSYGDRGDIRGHFVPKNIEYLIHRYGEWLMLMIGESVLSLLIVITVEQQEYYALYSLGLLSVIALQALIYDSEPLHVDGHALWRSLYTGFVYSVWIQILSMGLIVFGASYKVMLTTLYQREHSHKMRRLACECPLITPQATTGMFSGSLAIVLLSLELVFVSHEGLRKHLSLFVKNPTSPKLCEYNWPLVAAAAAKVTLILFVATIGLWTTKNTVLTGVAFAVILAMVALRATTIYYLKSRM